MPNNRYLIFWLLAIALLASCASRKVGFARYYFQHQQALIAIEQSYKTLYKIKPFSVEFTDRSFNYLSLEIITDSLKYIYEFNIQEPRLRDTLVKYNLPVTGVTSLIKQMQSIRCTWINSLDYYSNNQKNYLVFMSMRPLAVQVPFGSEKYFILTFYNQPQYFDADGRLEVNRRQRQLRKIDGQIFHRINDKVCYAISERFR